MNKCVFDMIGFIADYNQYQGNVVEIGSMNFGDRFDLRRIIPHANYIGYDINYGFGVDTTNISSIHSEFADVIICSSVLEHDRNPDETFGHIDRIAKPDVKMLFTIPFRWPIHDYPDDYRRLTASGLKLLLRESVCAISVQTFQIGKNKDPHTVVGLINNSLPEHVIKYIKRSYYFEDGLIKGVVRNLIPPFLYDTIKGTI